MMAKSQVSNEFLILIGVVFLTLLLFLYYAADSIRDVSFKRELDALRDTGFMVQHELFLASEVKDGYLRSFEVPDAADGYSYNLSITQRTLILVSDNSNIEQSFAIPLVVGNVTKGTNTIARRGGVIYVNP
jgi:hypothetical protein